MAVDSYVVSFVMAGGRGSRLEILTKDRSKPAVNILGHYRIFDFVATNVENSGIPVMLIATQFEPGSLSLHIGDGKIWGFDGVNRKLEIVHPHEVGRHFIRFDGTADSVRKNIDRINRYNPHIVLVLGGDHIYAMNYKDAILQHEKNKADITIMTNAITEDSLGDVGIVKIDEFGRIIDFAEKPTDKEVIESFRLTKKLKKLLGIDKPDLNFLASMGNYIFFWDRLKHFLGLPGNDFGTDVIPAIKENNKALYAYVFSGYWRDVGKIRDYFDCNMEFTDENPPIDLLKNQIRTYERHLPCAHIAGNATVHRAILSPGNIIHSGSVIRNSVLGYQIVIEEGCNLEHCVLLSAGRNEYHNNQLRREYTTHLGKGSSLKYVILDRNVWVGENVDISPHNGAPEERKELLQNIGLKPYNELSNGTFEGDFCIEPETGILVVGKQNEADPKKPILPDGLRC